MIKIGVDASGPHAAVNGMLQKLQHLRRVGVGQELSAWQVEDLNRNKPFTMRSRAAGRAATVIRPHSLFEVKRSALYQRRRLRRLIGRKKRAVVSISQGQPKTSTRPILRAEMYSVLQQRMRQLLKDKITWR